LPAEQKNSHFKDGIASATNRARGATVAARLAGLLLELAHQIGEHHDNGEFLFPPLLTHEEMTSMACTTRETVTRTLGQSRKDGWIAIEDSLVTIRHPELLQTLA
jgi:CRP-like cAMP-binding protein